MSETSSNDVKDDMFDPSREPASSMKLFTCFLKLVVPAILTNVVGHSSIVTNSVFAGRLNDPIKLAAVGLSNVCCNILVCSIMIGLNSAQETLTSQAYGAGNSHLCGVYLNRGRFILCVVFVPLAVILSFLTE